MVKLDLLHGLAILLHRLNSLFETFCLVQTGQIELSSDFKRNCPLNSGNLRVAQADFGLFNEVICD